MSVMKQSLPAAECIIVDNASPDDSIDRCLRLIAEYNGPTQFRILHHEKNRGLSAARNTGTDAATGDYILYLDSDDELPSDSIKSLASPLLKDSSIEMVLGNYDRFPEGCETPSNFTPIKHLPEQEIAFAKGVRNFFFNNEGFYNYAWNRLIKKELLLHHNICFKEGLLWEDDLWTFFIMKYLQHLYIVPDVTYHYYLHPNSIAMGTSLIEKDDHFGVIYENIANNLTEGEKGREAKYYFRAFCSRYIRNSKNQLYRNSAERFRKALQEDGYVKEANVLKILKLLAKSAVGRVVINGA